MSHQVHHPRSAGTEGVVPPPHQPDQYGGRHRPVRLSDQHLGAAGRHPTGEPPSGRAQLGIDQHGARVVDEREHLVERRRLRDTAAGERLIRQGHRVDLDAQLVVDASVVVTALADDGADGDRVRERLRSQRLAAPHVIDLEVASAWRRLLAAGHLDARRAALALADLGALRIERAPHGPLLERCWELRANLTIYDAAYVALAERLGSVLLTGDARLANAPGARCEVELV